MKNSNHVEEKENQEEYGEEENEEENLDEIGNQLEEYTKENKQKKIKVYYINDNKNLSNIEEQDSDSIVIFISSSVRSSKNDIKINTKIRPTENVDEFENEEIGPKNSMRND